MYIWKIFSLLVCSSWLIACSQDPSQDISSNTRTMIIGGVPVHDHDFKRADIRVNDSNVSSLKR